MKLFHYHQDPLYDAAAAILAGKTVNEEAVCLEEGVDDIAAVVKGLKKGDKTNFGVVTDVGQNNISFKAKDLPITKIAFNQRKMGSKDFVLDQLIKLKEGVELEEAVSIRFIDDLIDAANKNQSKNKQLRQGQSMMIALKDMNSKLYSDVTGTDYDPFYNDKKIPALLKHLNPNWKFSDLDEIMKEAMGMGTATITAPGNKLHGKQVSIFHKFDDGRLNVQYAKSDKKGDVQNLTLQKNQYKLDEAALKQSLPTKENKQRLESFMKKFNALRDSFPDVIFRGTHDEKVETGLIDDGNIVQYLGSKIPLVHKGKYKLDEAALKQSLPTKENKQRLESFMKKFNALRDSFPDVIFRGTHDEKVETGLIDDGNIVQYLGSKIPLVHKGK